MKLFLGLAITILLCSHTVYCQQPEFPDKMTLPSFESQDNFTLSGESDCAQRANNDIAKGEPRLIVCFSYEGKVHPGSGAFYSNQQEFEEKYKVTYKLYNCDAGNEKCIKNYNQQVFRHLRGKFGRKWKKEVRKDVYGLK